MPAAHDVIILLGPTAVGKTAVGVKLAQRLNAEIISCDSMQAYRGIPILTQQPTAEEQAAVPHHLINIRDPEDTFSVAEFCREAATAIEQIQSHGCLPLIVGGTALYLYALMDGLAPSPPGDPACRAKWHDEAQRVGVEALHAKLAEVDSLSATKIQPHDARRIVRALEVFELTGTPLSSWHRQTEGLAARCQTAWVGLTRPRAELYARINARVDSMAREGVMEEVRAVLQRPVSITFRQAHGINDFTEYFAGRLTLEQALDQLRQRTRKYAVRQLSWFRPDPRIHWVTIEGEEPPAATAQRIAEHLRAAPPAPHYNRWATRRQLV